MVNHKGLVSASTGNFIMALTNQLPFLPSLCWMVTLHGKSESLAIHHHPSVIRGITTCWAPEVGVQMVSQNDPKCGIPNLCFCSSTATLWPCGTVSTPNCLGTHPIFNPCRGLRFQAGDRRQRGVPGAFPEATPRSQLECVSFFRGGEPQIIQSLNY